MRVEKAIEIIKKLLATANDKGASENEAMIAALKAQELMAKYDIQMTDIEGESTSDEIVDNQIYVGSGNKWKYSLAGVIATNFCCRVYICGSKHIVFYGYKKHAEVAKEVFTFLFNTGNKLANRYYGELYNRGESTKGVKNTFLIGYLHGIKSVLEKQCTALMLVIPKEVNDSYNEKMAGAKTRTRNLTGQKNAAAYHRGLNEGKNVATARSLEG